MTQLTFVRQADLLDGWLTLEAGSTKNGDGRKVKMTGEVYQLLAALVGGKQPDDLVFTRQDGSRVIDPRKAWYSLSVRCGLGRFVPGRNGFERYVGLNLHDFRRAAIRNMTRRGINQTVAMRISGHKTASVFRRYDIVDETDLIRASQLIEGGRKASIRGADTDTKTDTSRSESPVSH